MQIQSFKVFSNLAETASFSRAAEMNAITQSAVSQQVRALEQRFDVKLIERGRKSFFSHTGGPRLSRGQPRHPGGAG